ncbi:nitroreductase family deazaflavin-dependent oxidoreductase [Allokutzneria albata]|uniref:Deazaflavin-dependent oxidoreductase, nitroreductase family n=1 Tax=Allokutzneria albata TaxID=211114 RepID=A0A1G9RQC3_ALLAB|nr:nitroreductase family deazaflavin-dependent oxidoreductase [Allokutzneria albata]SDM25373.1 deazaflavin-dependent oxidoreductase, nitroreductase family [Allokutzneria albata]
MTDTRSYNEKVIDEFRGNNGVMSGTYADAPLLLLTTVGARSGKERTTPVLYLADGERFVVFASNGGDARHPAWYHNLVANGRAVVEVGAERFEAEVTFTEGAERDELYARQVAVNPAFGDFQRRTSRTIPVVALSRGIGR